MYVLYEYSYIHLYLCVHNKVCNSDYIFIVIVHPITVSIHIWCDIIICHNVTLCESIFNHFETQNVFVITTLLGGCCGMTHSLISKLST